jgi:hypothetical protein
MKKLLLFGLLLSGLAGCYQGYDRGEVNEPVQTMPAPCKRQEVYCYLTNRSAGDTLLVAPAKFVVDDSLVVAEAIQRSYTGSSNLNTVIRLCEGMHRVHVQFGPYTRDTTFVVPRDTAISLLASMLYRNIPELAHENDLAIAILIRDGKGGPD